MGILSFLGGISFSFSFEIYLFFPLEELISMGSIPQRDNKRLVLRNTTSFMAFLWCASPFMQDRKVQRLQFHNLLHRHREDLITRTLG